MKSSTWTSRNPRPSRLGRASGRSSLSAGPRQPEQLALGQGHGPSRLVAHRLGTTFEPGDALMVVPENDPAAVDELLAAGGTVADEALVNGCGVTSTSPRSRATLEAYQRLRPQDGLASLLEGEGWRAFAAGRQVVDLLEAFPSRLAPEELVSLLRPLPARAYSIASSPWPTRTRRTCSSAWSITSRMAVGGRAWLRASLPSAWRQVRASGPIPRTATSACPRPATRQS